MKRDRIFHVGFEPTTGVWTMIVNLSIEQKRMGVDTICVLYYTNIDYYTEYDALAKEEHLTVEWVYIRKIVDSTISILFNHELSRIIDRYCIVDNATAYVTFHDAHFSSAFLPVKSKYVERMCAIIHGCPYGLLYQKKWHKKLAHRYFARRLKNSSVECVAVSNEDINLFMPRTGIPMSRFHTIYNGAPSRKRKDYLRKDTFTVGFIGVLEERKDPELAIESIKLAHEQNPDIRMSIAGFGELNDYVKSMTDANQDFIEFKGSVNDPIHTFYPNIDVLLLTSRLEGLPMTILEAFSLGIPVISTSAGGIKEIVHNDINGYMVANNRNEISERILQLSKDFDLLTDLGVGAYNYFEKNLSIKKCATDYINLLKNGKI